MEPCERFLGEARGLCGSLFPYLQSRHGQYVAVTMLNVCLKISKFASIPSSLEVSVGFFAGATDGSTATTRCFFKKGSFPDMP